MAAAPARYEGVDAYSHGVFDHDRGKLHLSNPYDPGTRRHREWEDGYWAAVEAATDDQDDEGFIHVER